jgi:hypothetical protein
MPPLSFESAFLIRISLVSAFLPEMTQQIHSLRARGVISSHTARASGTEVRVFRKSAGILCTTPPATCLPAGRLTASKGTYRLFVYTAGGLGIEPRLTASKAAVLPLDDPPASYTNIDDFYEADETLRRHCFIILPVNLAPQCFPILL